MGKILPISVFSIILTVLAGINRGFDFSDEGLYVLLADPMQANSSGIFNYDLFFKFFYWISGYSFSLVELRFLRLLSYLAGAWALMGFWNNISEEEKPNFSVFWISCLGIFAGYGFLPPTLSYNALTVVLASFWLNLISKRNIEWIHHFYLGIILALIVYVKISVFPLLFIITIWRLGISRKELIGQIALLILPFLLLELLFLFTVGESALSRLEEGITLNSQRPSYGFNLILLSVLVGGFWFVLCSGLFFLLGYLYRSGLLSRFVLMIIGICSYTVLAYLTHITEEWNHLFLLFISAGLGFCIGFRGLGIIWRNPWAILLIFMPFILHLGSNVYWLRIGIHYWVFWVLAFLLLEDSIKPYFTYVLIPISFILVFNGIWWHPFEQDKPLWAEKAKWDRNGKEAIFLDQTQINILEKIEKWDEARGSGELLSAYRIPGVIWLLGKRIPFSPGFWEKAQLKAFFETKPKAMIYNNLETLPENWSFEHRLDLGQYEGNSLQIVWD